MAQQTPTKQQAAASAPNSINSLSPASREQQAGRMLPPSPMLSTRASFSDQLRQVPASPRAHRQPSISAQAFQELLSNPPPVNKDNSRFTGRDWKTIQVGEIIDPEEVHWAESSTGVEDATNLLITGGPPNCVLIREDNTSRVAINTFDYSDLNAYLLIGLGLKHPDEDHDASFSELIKKGREGKPIKLDDIKDLRRGEAFITLSHTSTLTRAVEIFGSGIHRIIVVEEGTQDVVGVLTQLRTVRFFWENGRNFSEINDLFSASLGELGFGAKVVVSINGDRPVTDALELMHAQSITSLPVVDSSNNVVGNISHVDVRLLTTSASLHLLKSSCIHFISVILSARGMDDGQDSFPVFYVNTSSNLAHTIARLVATRSHRMWIVDSPSHSGHGSAPSTPSVFSTSYAPFGHPGGPHTTVPPYTATSGASVSAGSAPGQHMSGRLSGVISLTDVLNLFARAGGSMPMDPDGARKKRRGSSSSSIRASMDSNRSSSLDLTGSGSMSGLRR